MDNCTNSLPSGFLEDISHGNFTVKCARFYEGVGCTGNFAEIQKIHHSSSMNWKLKVTKSIGPCDETGNFGDYNCTETRDPEPVVELFEDADFKGETQSNFCTSNDT